MSGIAVYEGETAPGLALHLRDPGPTAKRLQGGPISPELWTMYATVVEQTYKTEFVKRAIRGNAPAALACVLYGHDLGIPPMVALREIDMVDGRPAPGANLVTARIRDRGHSLSWEYAFDAEGNEVACTARGKRSDNGDTGEYTFSLKKAARANLAGQGCVEDVPRVDALGAGCDELARMLFADVFLGSVYTPEELGASVEGSAVEPQATDAARARDVVSRPGAKVRVEAGSTAGVSEGGADERDGAQAARATADETPSEVFPAALMARLQILCHEEGWSRDERLEWASGMLERPVTSFSDLSVAEGTRLVDVLAAAADSRALDADPGPPEDQASADQWLLTEAARDVILETINAEAAFDRWDTFRTDAAGAILAVRECSDGALLLLWADRERRSRDRKGVLAAIDQRLTSLQDAPTPRRIVQVSGGEGVSASGEVERERDDGATAPSPAAGSNGTVPEALQAVDPIVRLRALIQFVAANPSSVEKPAMWTEAKILQGIYQQSWGKFASLEDVPEETLALVWSLTPLEVRSFIESLPADDQIAMSL